MKLISLLVLIPNLLFSVNPIIDDLQDKLSTSENIDKIEILIDLSIEYAEIDTIKSFEFSNQAIELSNQLGKYKALVMANLGEINYLIGNYQVSLKLLLASLTHLPLEIEVKADILMNIGLVYTKLQQYDRSLSYFDKALNIYQNLELKTQISEVFYSIAITYDIQHEYEIALQYFQKSLQLDKELGNTRGMATLCYLIGCEYELLAEYVKALESYLHCLKLNEELGDQEEIGDSYNVIGNIFQTMGDFDLALEYYDKNLAIQKKLDNKYGISIAYNNIGIINDDKKKFNKAFEYYFKALKIDEEREDKDGIATVTNNIGIVYYELKQYNKALEYYQQSLSLSKELNNVWGIANTLSNIAEVYLDLNQYAKSFSYLKEGLELAGSIEAKDLILESFHIYSKLYAKTNNYEKAFVYYKNYTELKDTLFTTSIRKVAEIQRLNETEKKEKENELLRKENQIKHLKIERNKHLKYSLFVIIILTISSTLLIFKRYWGKRKENLLINNKNKLITKQKKQLDLTLEELKVTNLNLERGIKEIKTGRKRLQLLNKIIRHDLSNDFVVIKSAVNIFRKTSNLDMIEEIDKRVDQSLNTISNYRKYESFIDSNADLAEIEISNLLKKLIAEYSKIKFKISGKCIVYADEALNSVFTNLISNSIKHGDSTQIDIKISSENNMCKIILTDNGNGIPDEIKNKIFDDGFVYGDAGHTGIGLHIVKETIERFGGYISVENNEPIGTTFIINLRRTIE